MTLFAERYEYDEVRDRLGGGVFGVVFKAYDTRQKFDVALKLLRKGTLPEEAYQEAQLLTKLGGDYVLQVHNTGVADDIPFLATRIAAARSTEDRLQSESPFGVPPDLAIAWTRNALLGLASVHGAGWIHRDVKPANTFLDKPDWALLGDFGVAGMADVHGRVAAHGDPLVRSPEMYTTGSGDVRSDIYSTGVTMYRLLTGKWPFDPVRGPLPAQIVAADYPRLSDIAPHVSRRLEARVARAMAIDPAARYQTAREMHAALSHRKLTPRAWQRIAAHAGHDRCWVERRRMSGGTARFQACVIADGAGTFQIDCRRTTGERKKVARHCIEDLPEARLLVELRKMFRALG